MKKYNGKEIFEMLYDEIITEDQCLKVIHPEEENHYILRNRIGHFDEYELLSNLLYKPYNFEIVNQKRTEMKLLKLNKEKKIKELEKELKKLKEV